MGDTLGVISVHTDNSAALTSTARSVTVLISNYRSQVLSTTICVLQAGSASVWQLVPLSSVLVYRMSMMTSPP